MKKEMTKKKFILSITAYAVLFVLFSCLVGYGAWAIMNASFRLGGNISFVANNVMATISAGQVSGGTLTDADSKLKQITINTTDNGQTAMATWSGLDLQFPENGADVTISFTVTNNHTEKDLLVEVGEMTGTKTNADMTITADGGSANSVVIAKNNDSAEYVVTFNVTDKTKSASITNFDIPIEFSLTETYTASVQFSTGASYTSTINYRINGNSEEKTIEGQFVEFDIENVSSITFRIVTAPGSWSGDGYVQLNYLDVEKELYQGDEVTINLTEDTTFVLKDVEPYQTGPEL